MQVHLKNMLKDFLNLTRKMTDAENVQTFDLNLNIFAKDDHESVLVERWAFEVQQNSMAEIAERVQDSIKQR